MNPVSAMNSALLPNRIRSGQLQPRPGGGDGRGRVAGPTSPFFVGPAPPSPATPPPKRRGGGAAGSARHSVDAATRRLLELRYYEIPNSVTHAVVPILCDDERT